MRDSEDLGNPSSFRDHGPWWRWRQLLGDAFHLLLLGPSLLSGIGHRKKTNQMKPLGVILILQPGLTGAAVKPCCSTSELGG